MISKRGENTPAEQTANGTVEQREVPAPHQVALQWLTEVNRLAPRSGNIAMLITELSTLPVPAMQVVLLSAPAQAKWESPR